MQVEESSKPKSHPSQGEGTEQIDAMPSSSRVSHTGRDSVDRQERRVKQLLAVPGAEFGPGAFLPAPREQFNLQIAERVDVRVAHGDRPLEHGGLIEQPFFARDLKRDATSARVF